MASVTLSMEEFSELKREVDRAQAQVVALQQELVEARQADPGGRIEMLAQLSREALTVVRFGIANMPPLEVKKWPTGAVKRVAELLPWLPNYGSDDQSLAIEMTAFADDTDQIYREDVRSRG